MSSCRRSFSSGTSRVEAGVVGLWTWLWGGSRDRRDDNRSVPSPSGDSRVVPNDAHRLENAFVGDLVWMGPIETHRSWTVGRAVATGLRSETSLPPVVCFSDL